MPEMLKNLDRVLTQNTFDAIDSSLDKEVSSPVERALSMVEASGTAIIERTYLGIRTKTSLHDGPVMWHHGYSGYP